MFFTGGYVAVPVAVAGRLPWVNRPRPRNLLFIPDIVPGLALKVLARFADQIAVSVEDTMAILSQRASVVVTGYPVRRELLAWTQDEARKVFNLDSSLPTLLVYGGSKGARSINRAVLHILPELLNEMQVIHISGTLDWLEVVAAREKLTPQESPRYLTFPYLHEEIGAAQIVADLVVSRAGASILGEYPHFAVPAILVPYPYAWHYQQVNARYLTDRGAAVEIADEKLLDQLLPTILALIHDQPRLQSMRKAMRSLERPQAAGRIAQLITGLGEGQGRERR
jgi:UDP-N-acetylglucosamine--N-acetylmuramyl-(pentapeptide) pyrophosphoryl-undecaprenol N-acetylglucosamine transferase